MALYMVRVELFNASGEDYNEVHEKLAGLGLKKTVEGEDGTYNMPTGTYFGESSLSITQLRERASQIADQHSRPRAAAVFVSQVVEWQSWLFKD